MTGAQAGRDGLSVSVRNLGGIDAREVSVGSGATVLVGRNATNRTSLLRAVAAALGGSAGELKRTAEEGRVRLSFGDESRTVCERRFRRADDRVVVEGRPLVEDAGLVDCFACLLEDNPARRAVRRADGAALREVIMQPVDEAAIVREIDATRRELADVDDRLAELDRRLGNRPALVERRERLADELEDVESELEAVREALEEAEADVAAQASAAGGAGAADAAALDDAADLEDAADLAAAVGDESLQAALEALESVREELESTRADLERVRDERETEREAVASLESELAAIEDELADLDVPDDDLEALESEIGRLQRRSRELAGAVERLQSVVELNERLVDGDAALPGVQIVDDAGEARGGAGGSGRGSERGADGGPGRGADRGEPPDDDPLAALDPASRDVECWTCGETVERADVAARVEDLRAAIETTRDERAAVEERLDELRERRSALRERGERRDELRSRRDDLRDELAGRRDRIAELEDRERELLERIDDLEADVDRAGIAGSGDDREADSGGDRSADSDDDGSAANDPDGEEQVGRGEGGEQRVDTDEGDDEVHDEAHEAVHDDNSDAAAELVALSERRSELEYQRGTLEEELGRVEEELADAEERAAERDRLAERRDDFREELAALRDRIVERETAAVETFNDHVATVVDRLGYENLERVWLERKPGADAAESEIDFGSGVGSGVDSGAPATDAGSSGVDSGSLASDSLPDDAAGRFELHVVRSDDGTVFEDTIDHLSESEREVLGLVVALAGFLVHDVGETVPVVLLDSLEAIDADRIAALLDYFAEQVPYLLVALLPEDAQAVADDVERFAMGE